MQPVYTPAQRQLRLEKIIQWLFENPRRCDVTTLICKEYNIKAASARCLIAQAETAILLVYKPKMFNNINRKLAVLNSIISDPNASARERMSAIKISNNMLGHNAAIRVEQSITAPIYDIPVEVTDREVNPD